MARARGVSVTQVNAMQPLDSATLQGLQAASWVNFAFGLSSVIIVLLAFRNLEVIGRVKRKVDGSSTVEEGILSGERLRRSSYTVSVSGL